MMNFHNKKTKYPFKRCMDRSMHEKRCNMFSKKAKKIISGIIILILVLAMIIPTLISVVP